VFDDVIEIAFDFGFEGVGIECSPCSRLTSSAERAFERGKLPVCVVKMRSLLFFTIKRKRVAWRLPSGSRPC
jgi:hypothetical protein